MSKCCAFHGSQIWKLDCKPVEELHTTWRKAVRRLLDIPRNAKTMMLPLLMKCRNFIDQLAARFVNFLHAIAVGTNSKLHWILQNCVKSGNIMSNIAFIGKSWGIPARDMLNGEKAYLHARTRVPDEIRQRAQAVLDFMNMENESDYMNFKDIINYLCTFDSNITCSM